MALTFGSWLRANRKARSWTQDDLIAQLEKRSLGVTKSAVSHWENDSCAPEDNRLAALWKIFALPDSLVGQVILAMNDPRFPFPEVSDEPSGLVEGAA